MGEVALWRWHRPQGSWFILSVSSVLNLFSLLVTSWFFRWDGLAAPSGPPSQQLGSWKEPRDGEGDHSFGSPLTHPPWLCQRRKRKKKKNHRPTVGQPWWATCQGGGGNRAWEKRTDISKEKPGQRSLPRRRVTERALGECCGVRSLGSDQPAVNILPHQGAKMTAQCEGGGAECGEEVQAWETKPASSLSPLMGSQGWRRGPVEGMEPPKPLGFCLIELEV